MEFYEPAPLALGYGNGTREWFVDRWDALLDTIGKFAKGTSACGLDEGDADLFASCQLFHFVCTNTPPLTKLVKCRTFLAIVDCDGNGGLH